MGGSKKPVDERQLRLRMLAREHGGVVPVPFLGTTWQARGAAYWWRRVGAVVVMLLGLALVGGMSVAFTIGIVGDGRDVIRIVLAVLYGLTAVFGVRGGLRTIAAAPLVARPGVPRTFFPNGLLALAVAPYGTGFVLTILVAMFGRDFIGERGARSLRG